MRTFVTRYLSKILSVAAVCMLLVPRTGRAAEPTEAAPVTKSVVEKAVESARLSGFAIPWLRYGEAPAEGRDPRLAFRLRYARLAIKSDLAKDVSTTIAIALDDSKNPFFNLELTWKPHDAANVTVGQFRMPFGELVTNGVTNLVMIDRPDYMGALTKKRYRDIGVMLHTGKQGLYNGLVNYWFAVLNGNGIGAVGSGKTSDEGSYRDLLYVGRVMLNPGKAFVGKAFDVRIGASVARTLSPALLDTDLAVRKDKAKEFLGTTYTPYDKRRETQLLGAEFLVKARGLFAQGEWWQLKSEPLHGATADTKKELRGWHADLGYTIAPIKTQLVFRRESFDKNPDASKDETTSSSIGFNYLVSDSVWLSLFGTSVDDHDGTDGADFPNNHIDARMRVVF